MITGRSDTDLKDKSDGLPWSGRITELLSAETTEAGNVERTCTDDCALAGMEAEQGLMNALRFVRIKRDLYIRLFRRIYSTKVKLRNPAQGLRG